MNYSISSLKESFEKKEVTPQEIFDFYKKRIAERNPTINAYLSTSDKPSHEKYVPGLGISGIPFALKDNFLVQGQIATAGSKILEKYISSFTSTAAQKLLGAGGNLLGKTNMDEFAMGSTTENSAFGPTRNPLDPTKIPGGTSGGSAAAVADNLCVFALGSDTGGSVRYPASMCGVVGFKPSYGRVSRHGLMATASSLDQIGPLTKNVKDAAAVMDIIAGYDPFDSTTVKAEAAEFSSSLNKEKVLKIGVPKEFFDKGLADEVRERVEATIKKLGEMGHKIEEITIPNFKYGLAAYYIINPCEISANLSRYDGIRYGLSAESSNLLGTYLSSRSEGLGAEVKRRVMIGAYALSAGYYDAYYLKAQKVRALIKKDFDEAFKKVDVIVGPTAPSTAYKIGDKMTDPLSMYLEDIYTVPVNLIGAPAISIPCGLGSETNMPVGFQIIGDNFDDQTVLSVSYQLEKNI